MMRWQELPRLAFLLAGFAALGVTVASSHLFIGPTALLCVLRFRRGAWPSRLPWPALTLGVGCGLLFGGLLGAGGPLLAALALCALQVRYCLGRRGPQDDRASVLITTLMLVLAAVLDDTLLLAPALGVWAICLPLVLLRAELESFRGTVKDAGRVQAWALRPAALLSVLAAVLFVLLPRLQGSVALPDLSEVPPQARTGFSAEVELGGGAGLLLQSDTPVFRVSSSVPVSEVLYFRGLTLDSFDGTTWRRSARTTRELPIPEVTTGVRFDVELEPSADGLLFTTGQVGSLDVAVPVEVASDAVFQVRPHGVLRYSFVASPPFGPGSVSDEQAGELSLYRTLPRDRDARLAPLALELAGGAGSAQQRVERLASALQERYTYTRQMPQRSGGDPLTDFLFVQREGHCEYFASAMAVLARELGIPARVVSGYAGGDRSPVDGRLLLREGHAHAWTEVWLEDRWVVVDPTPGALAPEFPRSAARWRLDQLESAWRSFIIGYDAHQQQAWVLGLGRAMARPVAVAPGLEAALLALVAGVGGLIVLLAALWRVGGRSLLARLEGRPAITAQHSLVARAHQRARATVQRAGWNIPPQLPPVEAAEWLIAEAGTAATPLLELAWLHYEVRYGGASDAERAARAAALHDELSKLPGPA